MTQDAYWDDLGLAWTAIRPNPQILAPRLKERLRRQTAFAAVIFFAGVPLSLAGCALGVWTVWFGASTQTWNFIPRGLGLLAISLMAVFAAASFRGTLRDDAASLRVMIELSLSRTEKWRQALGLAWFSCAAAALFGMAGYGISVYFKKPHLLAPVEPLIITLLLGLVFLGLQKKAKQDILKYRHLKNLLLEES
jgi:hypothetical protein